VVISDDRPSKMVVVTCHHSLRVGEQRWVYTV